MKGSSEYAMILGNMTRGTPLDIDSIVYDGPLKKGADLSFVETRPIVSANLWSRAEDDISYIGIRVTQPITNQHTIAADLAAAAVERQIFPVFLSWIGQCGLQQSGFRVELIGGANDDEKRACEEQVKRFWNFAIIIDAADISTFPSVISSLIPYSIDGPTVVQSFELTADNKA